MTTEWTDLPTLQDVAKAQADGWEIEFANSSSKDFAKWSGLAWHADRQFRARPRQPKKVKSRCFMNIETGDVKYKFDDIDLNLKIWIRQPHLDLEGEVPE